MSDDVDRDSLTAPEPARWMSSTGKAAWKAGWIEGAVYGLRQRNQERARAERAEAALLRYSQTFLTIVELHGKWEGLEPGTVHAQQLRAALRMTGDSVPVEPAGPTIDMVIRCAEGVADAFVAAIEDVNSIDATMATAFQMFADSLRAVR